MIWRFSSSPNDHQSWILFCISGDRIIIFNVCPRRAVDGGKNFCIASYCCSKLLSRRVYTHFFFTFVSLCFEGKLRISQKSDTTKWHTLTYCPFFLTHTDKLIESKSLPIKYSEKVLEQNHNLTPLQTPKVYNVNCTMGAKCGEITRDVKIVQTY